MNWGWTRTWPASSRETPGWPTGACPTRRPPSTSCSSWERNPTARCRRWEMTSASPPSPIPSATSSASSRTPISPCRTGGEDLPPARHPAIEIEDRDPMYLTARQRELYEFLQDYIERQGEAPTYQEIGRALRLKSTNAVAKQLKVLEEKGYVRSPWGNKKRALTLVEHGTPSFTIPLLGTVAAGKP